MNRKTLFLGMLLAFILGACIMSQVPSKIEPTNGDIHIDTEIIMRKGQIIELSGFERFYVYSGFAPNSATGVITLLYLRDITYGGMGASVSIYVYRGEVVYLFNKPYEVIKLQEETISLRRVS